jgi:hypothetical protein
VTTFSIDGTTGAVSFAGNITGGSNITITGTGKFDGLTSAAGNNWAIVANSGQAAYGGVYADSQATGGVGVSGLTSSGIGIYGEGAAGGVGVKAVATGGGTALLVNGPLSLDNSTFTWHGFSIASPAGTATSFLANDGVWRTLAKALIYQTVVTGGKTATGQFVEVQTQDGLTAGWLPLYA